MEQRLGGSRAVPARITYLTRGHGFGHAARDLRILRAIEAREPEARVTVASSGTGAEFFRVRGVPVVDLAIPDLEDQSDDARWRVWRFLYSQQEADLVVSDEVFAAPSFCRRVMEKPCVLVSDWLPAEIGAADRLDRDFELASRIIVPDFPRDDEPSVSHFPATDFTGPLVEPYESTRSVARSRLDMSSEERVVVLSVGGLARRPAALAMILSALSWLKVQDDPRTRLYILAEAPRTAFPIRDPRVEWCGSVVNPEDYFKAADIVLIDALGFATCELVRNDVRCVALYCPDRGRVVPRHAVRRLELLGSTGRLTLHHVDIGGKADPVALDLAIRRVLETDTATMPTDLRWGDAGSIAESLLAEVRATSSVIEVV